MDFLYWLFEMIFLLIKIIIPIVFFIGLIIFIMNIPSYIRNAKEIKQEKRYQEQLKAKYNNYTLAEKKAIYNDLVKINNINKQVKYNSRRHSINDEDELIKEMAILMQYENQESEFYKLYRLPVPDESKIEYDIQFLKSCLK